MTKILQALLLFLAIAGYSQETRTISGIILDENDHQPIPGASIFVENNSIGSKTSQSGIAQITLPENQKYLMSTRLVKQKCFLIQRYKYLHYLRLV